MTVVVVGLMVFVAQLLLVTLLLSVSDGQALGWLSSAGIASLISMAVVMLILPFLLQLSQRAKRAEKGIASTKDGYWVLNAAGRFLEVNPGYCEMMGYSRETVMGMSIADFEEVATMPQIQAQIQRIMAKGNELFETRHRHRSGRWVDLEIAVTVVDSDCLVAFLRDISAHKAAARAMQEATRLAEAASQAKSLFLANMSHEIRTPMNGVLGMTDLVLGTELQAQQRDYLNRVKSSAQSLLAILNDILDFSKIEAGRLDIETIPYALSSTVEEAIASLEPRAAAKGLSLTCEVDPHLPAMVCGDPLRLRQVLLNLCDNAIKFTAQGGVFVSVAGKPGDDHTWTLQVLVKDSGMGIPADKQQSIFEAFNQADSSTTRRYGGTGLGLTICAKLVHLMGGDINVRSTVGEGSEFGFSVRVACVADGVTPVADFSAETPPPPVDASSETTSRKLQVLLVEDHPVNQILATALLEKWGHDVVLAENGQQAVDRFAERAWDLILMDIQMPVMGGIEATRLIRAQELPGRRVPIIAVTANAMAADREACIGADMDDHLGKPYTPAALRNIMDRALRRVSPQL